MAQTIIKDARVLHDALLQEGWVVRGGQLLRDIPERPIFLRVLEAYMDETTAVVVIADPFSPDGRKKFVIHGARGLARPGPRGQWLTLALEADGTQLVLDKPPLHGIMAMDNERTVAERVEESVPE